MTDTTDVRSAERKYVSSEKRWMVSAGRGTCAEIYVPGSDTEMDAVSTDLAQFVCDNLPAFEAEALRLLAELLRPEITKEMATEFIEVHSTEEFSIGLVTYDDIYGLWSVDFRKHIDHRGEATFSQHRLTRSQT